MKVFAIASMLTVSLAICAQKAEWVSTTSKNPWVTEKSISSKKSNDTQNQTIEIYPDRDLQVMTGFWWLLQ